MMPARRILAGCLALAGVSIAILGVLSFRRAGTTVNPMQPEKASSLVTSGIYRVTRNPMYLGLLLGLIAWAVFLSNVLAFLFLPAFILYLNRFQIGPEEAALTRLFGQEFVHYQSHVRRWL
jgi:protein-S-isoprenylcysteine O-methyltransferase Ste14